MNRGVRVCGLAVVLGVALSGCDWGHNNRYYSNSKEQTEAAVKRLYPEAPRKEGKKGEVIYGEEKPHDEPHFPTTDIIVRIKPEKKGMTEVQVKARDSHEDVVLTRRERDSDVEKRVLDRIGNELGASKPAEAKPAEAKTAPAPAPAEKK